MKTPICVVLISVSAALLNGCATGPKFAQASIPPLAADNGRIYFYRTAVVGAAVQPAVRLNGDVVGRAKPKGVFYADRPPGNYQVESSTEVKRRLSLVLEKAQTRYVRLNISMGFWVGHVYPELVEPDLGEKELLKCSFTGPKPAKE